MKEKLRILFCSTSDEWTFPIKKMLVDLESQINAEIFIISDKQEEYKDTYIDYSRFKSSLSYQKISDLQLRKYDIPRELIDNQISFLQADTGDKVSELIIKKELNLLFTQIEIFYEILEPDLVLIWNGQLSLSSAFKYMASRLDIPVFFAEKGVLPESWYIDPSGINADSEIAGKSDSFFKVPEEEIQEFINKIEEISRAGNSAWEQPQREDLEKLKSGLGAVKGKKIIFFPCQVENDTNIILFSKYFKTNISVIEWIMKDISDDYYLLVKTHPKGSVNKPVLKALLGEKGKVVDSLNIIDAVSIADIIVTINSTVGFEAAVRNKPVLQLGKGILSNKQFIKHYDPGKNSLLQVEDTIKDYNKNIEKNYNSAIRMGSYLYHQYYTFRDSPEKTSAMIGELIKGYEPKKKKFLYKEARVFFSKITYSDLSKFVSGKTMIKALIHKIKKRVFKTIDD